MWRYTLNWRIYSFALAISPFCLACKANALSRATAGSVFVVVDAAGGCSKELFWIFYYN
jgi:hypothetical protein